MKFTFECSIEANERCDIAAVLSHIMDLVEDEDYYHGGYDWCCADYSWSIEENEDEEDEEEDEEEDD